ncbi:MAG: N-carbamoyl-L-amino-acid hydrolase [Paracidovorax wautersii]|uniref:N-carbamoyl-L-amino-acid hydrolase n=1 Tax=Paracidovorax wautersii TaxID=1177982 RepID=A0A7V8JQE3_9BURK|nr:MAG: N-carbamoyl-L-amino-acid hydrolase [Paracidovorax wautersii]
MNDPDRTLSTMRHVDGARLIRHLTRLASFGGGGASVHDGVRRESLTDAELAAKRWLLTLFPGPRYAWTQDHAANFILRRRGLDETLPPVLTGSHLDTQPTGGWLDGAYGVVAGYEACMALDDAGIDTPRSIEIVAWTNEEGLRFAPGAMGSSAFANPVLLERYRDAQDADGVRFEDACHAARAGLPALPLAALGRPVHAYLEAHIEQGPVMEARGASLGIVEGIQGVRWYRVTVQGRSAHAGTTPAAARQDALLAAARLITTLHDAVQALGDDRVRWTVGQFVARPGSVNTIAEQADFTIDLRHPDAAVLARIESLLEALLQQPHGACTARMSRLMDRAPTVFHPLAVQAIQAAVAATGAPHCRLTSGAFHDAMYLADICPAAMLFVPSIDGISHHPQEHTRHEDLITGTRALTAALLQLAH